MKKHKRRLYIIIFFLSLTILVSWRMAVKPSIDLYKVVKQQEEQVLMLKNAPQQITLLEKKLEQVNRQIGTSVVDIKQENIVNEISHYINHKKDLELCLLTPVHKQQKENYWVNTYLLELQGGFINLIQLLNYFENEKSIGKISSTEFFIIKEGQSGSTKLRMKLYVQSFTKS